MPYTPYAYGNGESTSTGTTANIISTNQVWQYWCQSTATTGTSWTPIYASTTGGSYSTGGYQVPAWRPVEDATETPETRAERQLRHRVYQEGVRERERAYETRRQRELETRRLAERRALEVLDACLTPEQRGTYREFGYIEVLSSRGRTWRILSNGQQGNCRLMRPGIGYSAYCAHPPGGLPDADAHLAQMLALTTDEDAFMAIAHPF